MLSQLARSIPQSPTLTLNETAARMRERGEAVIHLGGGEPKTKAPMDALLAAAAKIASADVKYTPTDGLPALKKAVLRYTEQHYGLTVDAANVVVSPGAKAALYTIFLSLLDPQDEVVLLAPYWVSYPEMVRMVRAEPVVVRSEEGRFQPRLEEVEAAISPATKMLVVNSPNNPSGVVYDDAFIQGLVELAEARGFWLVVDDIYHQLVFDRRRAAPATGFATRAFEEGRVLLVNGISKLFGMTGFRIGWTVAPRRIVQAMANVQGQTVSCPSALQQVAAIGALEGMPTVIDGLRMSLENARGVLARELATLPGVRLERPGGTFYCLPDFSRYEPDSNRLSKLLLEKAKVVTVPGKEFGMEGHLRMSFCGGLKDLTEGVARIRWVLDPDAPQEMWIGDRKHVRDWR